MRFRREKDGADDEFRVATAVAVPGPIDVDEALSGVTRQIEEISESAERRAAEVLAEAEGEADRTRAKARAESRRVLDEARAEAERSARRREQAASETVAQTKLAVNRVNEALSGLRQCLDQASDELRAAIVPLDDAEREPGPPGDKPAQTSAPSPAPAAPTRSAGAPPRGRPAAHRPTAR